MSSVRLAEKFCWFIKRQTLDIHKEGIGAFVRKLWRFLKLLPVIFFSALLLPIIPFIRLIRPFVLIRFGRLDSGRIGHYAANTEMYLCERDIGLLPKHTLDVFFNYSNICNYQLKEMLGRVLHISSFARYFYIANHLLPGYKKHIIPLPSDRDVHGFLEQTPVHLFFTPEEEKRGYEELVKNGIPADAKFICFHARDSAYLDAVFLRHDWYYHNYRDSDIDNFLPAVEELAGKGYYMIRIGSRQKKAIKSNNTRIIDYSFKFRSEFLDIFLGAKCVFYLGDPCGINSIPTVFRRPIVTTNLIPLEYVPTWRPNYLFIPKKLWLRKEHRFMSFREVLESGTGRFLYTQQYDQIEIDIVDNTSEEIKALAIEMDERLKGTWQTTEEDEELQRRFWSFFKKSKLHGTIKARIGADFLKQNQDLLK